MQLRPAAEADASGKQQLKQMQTGQLKWIDAITRGAAAEADAIGEQQLCTESCPALDYSRRRTRGEVAERAKLFVHTIPLQR